MNVVRNVIIGIVATVLVIALLLVIFIYEPDRMDQTAAAQEGKAIARGAKLYDQYCAGCHGLRGEGLAGVYPALNRDDLFENREDISFYGTLHDFVYLNIASGHPTQRMPSWSEEYGGPLRNDQIEDITQFVVNWQGPQPEDVPKGTAGAQPTAAPEPTAAGTQAPAGEGDPASGETVFAANCASCHGQNAEGGSLGPSLLGDDLAAQPDEYFRETITNGRAGTAMPAWGPILSAQQIEDVIAFLRLKQQQ
ncbi:MAG: c-type cytochrome [Anaerolineae bacterium]|jgi:mono/diheme cytochrome c family protein